MSASVSAKARFPIPSTSHPKHTASVSSPDAVREQARQRDAPRSALPFPPHTSHSRSRSTAEPSTSAAGSSAANLPRRARTRAASSAAVGSELHPRPRLPSMLTSVLMQRKAPPELRATANDADLVGSFTPTGSPRPRLQSLLTGSRPGSPIGHGHGRARSTSRAGARTAASQPTSPLSPLAPLAFTTLPRPRHQSDAPGPLRGALFRRERATATIRARAHESDPESDDPPQSPGLPSICRTPSSFSGSGSDEYFSTAPSSAGPPTPVLNPAAPLPRPGTGAGKGKALGPEGSPAVSLHAVLEGLERASMFRVRTACAACGRSGSNFPRCPKCGEMWCSRACRLQKSDGKRHVCAKQAGVQSQ